MTANHKFIDIVHKLGLNGSPLEGVYRRIQDRELFFAAYGKLYANQGAMTKGTDPQDIVDGMSVKRVDTIIEKLKNGVYKWKPVKRTYIPKNSKGTRPLGLPTWSDKLLQEVIRMVLEAYYEPRFSEYSHGFRPNRGCHTAIQQIHYTWTGTKWFIEGDIKGCYDNIEWYVLLEILGRDIKDNRFIKLIRKMLKAGYMENWKYHKTYSGTPQGGVVSPILSNILLNELDKFVEEKLLPVYNIGITKASNPEYIRIKSKRQRAKAKGNNEEAEKLMQIMRKLPSRNTKDPNYLRLKYNRYADDFILGFDGPHAKAVEIKEKIGEFLKTLKLQMSEEKTLITSATKAPARYLGYDIRVAIDNNRITNGMRALNMNIVLKVPEEVIRQSSKKYTKSGKTVHRSELMQCSDIEIVKAYDTELRGIVNYYSLADNVSRFYKVKYLAIDSAAKTLAAKHKQRKTWVYRKYMQKNEGLRHLSVTAENPKYPDNPYIATLGKGPIRVNKTAIVTDDVKQFFSGRNELVKRMLADKCEICGANGDVEVHHIKKLADIKKRYEGRKDPPPWIKFMIARNRKTIVVCKKCHVDIHGGRYDGPKVK